MISDEIVVAARKAFIGRWNGVVPFDNKALDADMRAALEAVEPMIRATALEEAAKVAEVFGQGPSIVLDHQARGIAAAIRAMKGEVG